MANGNGKQPRTTGEHIVSIYGHVTGLKKELAHLHERLDDNESKHKCTERKLNQIIWALIGGMGSIIALLLTATNFFK